MSGTATTGFQSVFRPGLFAGQVVVITGGGTGIGRCMAHELASLGATVVLAARRKEPLQATCAEIVADGGLADWIELNIRDDEQVDQVVAEILRRHGRIDGLINNAGGQFVSEAAMLKPKGWRAVIDTNLNGTFYMTQAVFLRWMQEHGGSIVTIVADMWNGFPGISHTGAARAAVVNLTQSLAVEWSHYGVRVNTVAPGGVLSSGLNNYPEMVQDLALGMLKKVPAARLGTESECSAAAVFLLSPAAAYITGASIRVDGGGSLAKTPMFPLPETPAIAPFDGFHRPTDAPDKFR